MIALHKLSHPGKCNALTLDMLERLSAEVESNEGSRVLIIMGEENHFSSGADLKGDFFEIFKKLAHLYRQIQHSPKIVIAAIDGYCLAGGFGLAAAADLALATPEAKFQLPECRRGLLAPLAASLAQNTLPRRLLLEMTLSGEPLSAQRLYEAGFLNRLVPRDKLLSSAEELAHSILKGGPQAIALTKKMLTLQGFSLEEAVSRQERALATGEPQEGIAAFVEKRAPFWVK